MKRLRGVLLLFFIGLWAIALWFSLGLTISPPAEATIRQLEEAPGQQIYQSRRTLRDLRGYSWQAIAFKRLRPDHSTSFYLRLVGFPGVTAIDRSQPLTLVNSMGETLTAADASQAIFTNGTTPEPTVGQYDLQPILPQLRAELPLRLIIPTLEGGTIRLQIPSALVQEWQTVAQFE